jgi:tetratricopeptide (TPR) repeat protein
MPANVLRRAAVLLLVLAGLAWTGTANAWNPDGPQPSAPDAGARPGGDTLREAEAALRVRNFEATIRIVTAALRAGRLPAARIALAYRIRGTAHLNLRQPEPARADFEASLALEPGDVHALFGRGVALSALDRPAEALADFERVLSRRRDPAIFYARGMAHLKIRDMAAASADFDQALALQPRYAPAYYGRGLVHHALGRTIDARDDYERALAIDPGFANARKALDALRSRRAAPAQPAQPVPGRNGVVQF